MCYLDRSARPRSHTQFVNIHHLSILTLQTTTFCQPMEMSTRAKSPSFHGDHVPKASFGINKPRQNSLVNTRQCRRFLDCCIIPPTGQYHNCSACREMLRFSLKLLQGPIC
ncbi:unnamed protein product [Laminaria digitata]